jgi:formate hydrogenlyase subunit 4
MLETLALELVAAPLVPGVVTRTKSLLTGRRGPPIWQLYADLAKLLRRGAVYGSTTSWAFRAAPLVALATLLMAAALLPLDGQAAPLRFTADAVGFAGLLALGRFALVLAALDTGSSFEGMGASRDVAFAALVEPGLLLAFVGLGIMAGDFSLSAMLGAPGAATGAASVLIATSVFVLALAECSRVPVDDPATHLELTMVHEVMVLEHSGPDLAMILYASALKLALFAAIVLDVLLPGARTGAAGVLVLLGGLIAMGVAVGAVEATMARLRLPRVPLYLAGGAALALFGIVLLLR